MVAAGLIAGLALPIAAAAQADNAAALAELEASLPGTLINDPTSLAWNTQGDGLEVDSVTGAEIPGGGGIVTLHFAGAEQAVDLGPVYVLKEPAAP